ncbi:hypothetical protein FPRO04_13214 [Fusarium proliferatum]|nr:hypothetical protein FPRO04_13214 [Fusarium proliferatum]
MGFTYCDVHKGIACEDGMHELDVLGDVTAEQNRLIIANLQRRHRFDYAKRHQQPLVTTPIPSTRQLPQFYKTTTQGHLSQGLIDPKLTQTGPVPSTAISEVPEARATIETKARTVEDNILNFAISSEPATSTMSDLHVFIRLEAEAPARAHSGYAIRTLIREKLGAVSYNIRQVFQVRSGWVVLATDLATRDFLVAKQVRWASALKPVTLETNKEWFTYVISDFPKRLTDFHGKEVDSDSIVSDEIEIQTGLTPVDIRQGRQFSDNPLTKGLLVSFLKPTKRSWSLFGSSAARLVDKSNRLRQCETYWGIHFVRSYYR